MLAWCGVAGTTLSAVATGYFEERVYSVSISGGDEKVVVLVSDETLGLLIPVVDLNGSVDANKIAPLLVDHAVCGQCVALNRIALVQIEEDTARATVLLKPEYLPSRDAFDTEDRKTKLDDLNVHSKAGWRLNGRASFNDRDNRELRGVLEGQSVLSLGNFGTLYFDGAYIHKDGWRRGDARLDFLDIENQIEITLGDTISAPGAIGSAVRLGGLRINRRLGVLPGFLVRPAYHFEETVALKSTVELFVDGQSVKKREVEAGLVEFNHAYTSNGRDLAIVVTDVAGNERVYKDRLFPQIRALRKGVLDFDVSLGLPRHGETYQDWFAAGTMEYGLVPWLSPQVHVEAADGYAQGSLSSYLGVGFGRLDLQGAMVTNDGVSGSFGRMGFSTGIPLSKRTLLQVGFDVYTAENYQRFGGFTLDEAGAQTFVSTSIGGFGIYGSAYRIGELNGGSADLRFGLGGFVFSAGVDAIEGVDTRLRAAVSYRPTVRAAPSISYDHLYDSRQSVGAVSIRSQEALYGVHYNATYAQDYSMDDDRSARLSLSQHEELVEWSYQISTITGDFSHGGAIAGGIAVADGSMFWTGHHDARAGYVVVDAEAEGVGIRSRSKETRMTNAAGRALVRVPALTPTVVKVDGDTLPAGTSSVIDATRHFVYPGKFGHHEVDLRPAGFVVRLTGGIAPDTINVNGKDYYYISGGVYIDNFVEGENTILVNDRVVIVSLEEFGVEVPTVGIDLFSGSVSVNSEGGT
ncbi:MAG: hypothetical protein ACPG1C_04880 [Alphaproteobacteria bacterium]